MSDDLIETYRTLQRITEVGPVLRFRYLSHKKLVDNRGITMAACKFIYRLYVDHFDKTGQYLEKTVTELAEEYDLWVVDGWSHLGYAIVTCLENPKLIDSYNKGNQKVLDTLIGKTVRSANMTVDPELIKEIIPHIITKWFSNH